MKYELYESNDDGSFILIECGSKGPHFRISNILELVRIGKSWPLDIHIESMVKNSYTKLLEFESDNIRGHRYMLTEMMEEHYPERFI